MRRRRENGQAILLVILALSIFLLGALGLAIDGAQMYAHRQMAQSAADAAAQAGIMSLFNKTNNEEPNRFGQAVGEEFTCVTGSDTRTPCIHARNNRFGIEEHDTVVVSFPPPPEPGVSLASDVTDPVRLIDVTITRTLQTGFIRLLGPETSTITARARAAIVDVVAPVPILVTHPTRPASFYAQGNVRVIITGGPERSIQVNSRDLQSIGVNGNAHLVDLSGAGPDGTGGEFGDFGGPSSFPGNLIPAEKYIQPASPILDPLKDVPAPAEPAAAPAPTYLPNGTSGCPAVTLKDCYLYYPGTYAGGIEVKNRTAIFSPGIYYMKANGFVGAANSVMLMCAGCAADADTGNGMMVYNSGGGPINVGANGDVDLLGPPLNSIYKDILFFNDREAPSTTHTIGGGGAVKLTGTIYINNSLAAVTGTPSRFQIVEVWGGGGSDTVLDGMIIVNVLRVGGNGNIRMNLNPAYKLNIRQVALVR